MAPALAAWAAVLAVAGWRERRRPTSSRSSAGGRTATRTWTSSSTTAGSVSCNGEAPRARRRPAPARAPDPARPRAAGRAAPRAAVRAPPGAAALHGADGEGDRLLRGHVKGNPLVVPRARGLHEGPHRARVRARALTQDRSVRLRGGGALHRDPLGRPLARVLLAGGGESGARVRPRRAGACPPSSPRSTTAGPGFLRGAARRRPGARRPRRRRGRPDRHPAKHVESDQDALAARSPEGFTPLHLAAFLGGVGRGPLSCSRRDGRRRRPRESQPGAAAALRGRGRDHEAAEALLEAGADPDPASRAATRRCSPPPTTTTRDGRAPAWPRRRPHPRGRRRPGPGRDGRRARRAAARLRFEAAHQRFFCAASSASPILAPTRQSALIRACQAAPTAAQRPEGTP